MLGFFAACALALTSCSGSHRAALHGKYGGTLELSGDDFRSLDPAHGYDVASWGFERLIYTGLLDYDASTRLVPKGATHWTVSPDGKTYTFFLRHDMHFEGPVTQGRLVTSADYAYELRRVLDRKVASQGQDFFMPIVGAAAFHDGKAQSVSGIRTPDPFTLVIQLTQPNPVFLNLVAMPFAFAVPHEVVEKYGEPGQHGKQGGFQEHAEGSGPFMLKSWRRQVDIQLDRNPRYWDPTLPYLDHIYDRFGLGEINSMMMYETGELDISGVPAADFVRITSNPKFKPDIDRQVQMAIYYVSLNCEMPPFDNVKVREAVNYAIDRRRILKLINNRGILATGVLPPGMPGFDPALKGYPYDPAKAKVLLREAGHPQGFTTTLWVPSRPGSDNLREAQSMQQDLQAVGVTLEIKQVDFPVWLTAVAQEKTVPMSINDWYQDFPDPSDFLDVLLNSKQARPDDGNNSAFYKSAAMDSLLNRAAHEMDPKKRLGLYRQANQLAVHDAPWICLYYPISYELHRPWVHGFHQHPVWPAVYEKIWLSNQGD